MSDLLTLPSPERLAGVIGLDLEAFDPHIDARGPGWATAAREGDLSGFVAGCAIAWGDTESVYVPWRTPDGAHTPEGHGHRRWLRDVFRNPDVTVVAHSATYDLGWLTVGSGLPWPVKHHDTMVYAALLDEHRRSYRLDAVAGDWLGVHKLEDAIADYAKARKWHPKRDLWRMPHELVGPYACQDARLTLDLLRVMTPRLREEVPMALRRMEHDVQRVLVAMRAKGIRIDLDHATQALDAMQTESAQLQRTMLRGLRPNAARELSQYLFEPEGMVPNRTATNEPSITKAWLKTLDHPTARALERVRWLEKQGGTFLKGILRAQVDGRIHGELHGLRSDDGGTVSGRLSSSKPNLQNQTAKGDPLHIVRRCFLGEVGDQWTTLDYSGQEARIAVHIAASVFPGARDVAQAYVANPRLDLYADLQQDVNGVLPPDVQIVRDQAKVLFLASMYGAGDAQVAKMLRVPTDTALLVQAAFRVGAPWVHGLKESLSATARVQGRTLTMMGRRARYRPVMTPHGAPHEYNPRDRRYSSHVALNRVVQGSAADQVKAALVALHREGITPMVTVHDEIDISTNDPRVAQRAAAIMAEVLPMSVPMVIDIESGPSWGESTSTTTHTGGHT